MDTLSSLFELDALAVEQHGMSLRYAKSTRGAKTPERLLPMTASRRLPGHPASAASRCMCSGLLLPLFGAN